MFSLSKHAKFKLLNQKAEKKYPAFNSAEVTGKSGWKMFFASIPFSLRIRCCYTHGSCSKANFMFFSNLNAVISLPLEHKSKCYTVPAIKAQNKAKSIIYWSIYTIFQVIRYLHERKRVKIQAAEHSVLLLQCFSVFFWSLTDSGQCLAVA